MSLNIKALSAGELLAALGAPDCVMLMGLPGSSKTILADGLKANGFSTLSANTVRGDLYGDESKQGDPSEVFGEVFARLRRLLDSRVPLVIDNTHLTRWYRKGFLQILAEYGRRVHIVLVDLPLDLCLQRNGARKRKVPADVIKSMAADLLCAGPPQREGEFSVVRPSDQIGRYYLLGPSDPVAAFAGRVIHPRRKLDLVGDIHGCYDELRDLMALLGYDVKEVSVGSSGLPIYSISHPDGRQLGSVGDLVDRGPKSDRVLNLMIQLVAAGSPAVQGNHDNKAARKLKGNNVKVGKSLAETLRQIEQHGPDFVAACRDFLVGLPMKYESEDLVMVHAAYREGVGRKYFENLSIYGDVDGNTDSSGRPIRSDRWAEQYRGSKTIVHGHERQLAPYVPFLRRSASGALVYNIDTSAAFGGRLTALRFPEMELVSVPARAVYHQDVEKD